MRCRALMIFLLLVSMGSLTATPSIQSGDEQGQDLQEGAPRPVIEIRGDLLSVKVRNAPWKAVLKEIERQTGISIDVKAPFTGTLTQEFEALPLEQGLRRLFRDANVLFFYTKGMKERTAPETLVRIWLLPNRTSPTSSEAMASKQRATAEAVEAAPAESPRDDEVEPEDQLLAAEESAEERLKALNAFAKEGNTEALQLGLLDPEEAIWTKVLELLAERSGQGTTDVLVGLTRSDDPEIRLRALSQLHDADQVDESTLLSTYRTALADEDSSVRGYAIEALAIQGGPDATGYLGQALRDPDPSIRILAIENVAQQGYDPALLQEALSDKDERVRSSATFWLKKGGSEGR